MIIDKIKYSLVLIRLFVPYIFYIV